MELYLVCFYWERQFQNSDNPIAKDLQRDIYIDNLITGVSTLKKAKLMYSGAKNLFKTASMNLREWSSNCKKFMKFIPHQDQTVKYQKVLGVYWNQVDDTMSIPRSTVETVSTKREILQRIASIFDPLGYFSPTILKAGFQHQMS